MQIRRELSIFLVLLIIFFIIVLFYQLNYTFQPPPVPIRIEAPIIRKNEKFESLANEHTSVSILIYYFA